MNLEITPMHIAACAEVQSRVDSATARDVSLLAHLLVGYRIAMQVLVPGAVFRGARPEARARGYSDDTHEAGMFMQGFVIAIRERYPHGVTGRYTDEGEFILSPAIDPRPVAPFYRGA